MKTLLLRQVTTGLHRISQHFRGTRMTLPARLLRLLPLLILFASAPVQATDDDGDLFFEMPVVLSATRLEQPVSESPIAVTTLDRQMIEASGARNIPDLLRYVPGMLVGHSINEFGDEPRTVVAYQGHSNQYSRQMQVLIDGRSIYEPVLGGVNWNNVPVNVDDIERIEVIRGPNASSYGSNSFLAVINIITRLAAEDTGYFVRSNVGTHGIRDLSYRFAEQGERLDYRVSLTSYNDNGEDGVDNQPVRDSVGSSVIDYRIDYQLDEQQLLTYQGGYSDSTQQARGSVRPTTFASDRDIENIAAYQYLRYENIVDENHSFKLQYYYNLFDKTDNYTSNIDFGSFPLTDDILTALGLPTNAGITGTVTIDPFDFTNDKSYTAQRHNLEATHYYVSDNGFRMVWGGGMQRDIGKSRYYFNSPDNKSRNIYRLFNNIESRITNQLNLNLGLLWEKSDSVGSAFLPRASLLARASKQHTFRVSYSEAIRTLFLAEQFGDIELTADVTGTASITSPTPGTIPFSVTLVSDILGSDIPLDNEHIIARELGYYGRFLEDDITLSARLFDNSISRLIDTRIEASPTELVPGGTGEVEIFDNLIDTTIRGIELELNYYLTTDTHILLNASSLRIDAGYNPADASALFPEARLQQKAREYRQSAPDVTAAMMLMHRFNERYSGSFSFFYVGDMAWLDTNRSTSLNGRRNTGGYRKADFRLSRKWRRHNDDISLSLVVQNILGSFQDYDATAVVAGSESEQNLTAYIEFRFRHR